MRIQGNAILYATHAVVCDPALANEEYMQFMVEILEDEAKEVSPREHARVLRNNNNDGTWGIKRLDFLQ